MILKSDNTYRIIIVLFTLIQIGAACILLNSLSRIDNWSAVNAEDSKGYLLAADFFSGNEVQEMDLPLMKYRLFSPAIPFAASLAGRFFDIRASFLAMNALLWIATALVFYEFLKLLLKDSFSAFAGGMILTSSLPVIEWGLPIMVDMGAWFFSAVVPFIYCRMKWKTAYVPILYGAVLGIAVLTKPTLVCLLGFVILCSLCEKRVLSAAVIFLTTSVIIFFVCSGLNLSISDFQAFGAPRHRGVLYLLSAAFFCFHWGWIFFFQEWKREHEFKKMYILYLVSFLIPYVLFVHNPRLFFLSYPAVIPLIVRGMTVRFSDVKKRVCILGAYILTSNVLTAVHLYVMRTVRIRDMESLINMFQ